MTRQPSAAVLGVGTAVPPLRWSQVEAGERLARVWNLSGGAVDRWQRIIAGSAIEFRHAALPPEEAIGLSTAQRMRAYEHLAPELAALAAERALAAAGIGAAAVTDLVVVSCTGFSAPGVDVALIERLGLSSSTRRTTIGFMGCFGGINGLRIAHGLCAADPRSVAVLVCVELCVLHMRDEPTVHNQVASALFGDGAAAAVLAGDEARSAAPTPAANSSQYAPLARIGEAASLLIAEGREWMTWRITNTGFAMTLTRDVPPALRRALADHTTLTAHDDASFIIHPGGPGVLDAADDALDLRGGRGIECAREILRRFGNMSSGTVLFVLEQALRRSHAFPMRLLAFGPGLTIESLRLEQACAE
jgi:predicted naringenin-chalcone synthase